MKLTEIEGKSIAMIVWNTAKEDDVHVYLGELQERNGEFAFINGEKGWKISLDEEQVSRLQPVTDDLKEMLLNANYAFSMNMEDLPTTDDTTGYEKAGVNWNNKTVNAHRD